MRECWYKAGAVRGKIGVLVVGVILAGCAGIFPGSSLVEYRVGAAGPAGGTVFYLAPKPFPCGVAGEDLCTGMEVAPVESERSLSWSGGKNVNLSVPDARSILLGSGLGNSRIVALQEGNDQGNSAPVYAAGYELNGYTDWHLPSADALNELCKYARRLPPGDTGTMCDENGSLRPGFSDGTYWSSSEYSSSEAWLQNFGVGNQVYYAKQEVFNARPVRSF